MSFSTYRVISQAEIARGTGLGVSLQKMGRGKVSAKLVITLRPDVATSFGWTDKDKIEVAIGEDEHHGLIRLRKHHEGSAVLAYRKSGDGRTRGGPFYQLNLGHVPHFVDRGEEKKWAIFEKVEDEWIEIVLPAWADETGPKAKVDRPRLSAGTVAQPPLPPRGRTDLAPALMGDPPPSRSALAQQTSSRKAAGGGVDELTRGEARRRAEQAEAPAHAEAEVEQWNRKAGDDDRLGNLIVTFGLTRTEAMIVDALLDGRTKTREALHTAVYNASPDEAPEIKIIDVMMVRIRKKLQARLVDVLTVRGVGHKLAPVAIRRVRALIEGKDSEAAA